MSSPTKSPIRRIFEKLAIGIAFVVAFFLAREIKTSLLTSASIRRDPAIQVVSEIQKSYSSFINTANDAQGIPQRIEAMDTTPKAKGDLGEIERFLKTFLNRMASQRNDLLLELEAIGWDFILDPDRIKKDRTLTESKMLIQRANAIVRKYKAQTYTLLDNTQKEISILNISENYRRGILNGFKEGMANQRSQIDEIWDLEIKAISEIENIIALLAVKQGAWEVQNGELLFANQSDVDNFNSYLTAIQEHLARQQAIQKQSIATMNKNLNKFKN